MTTPITSFSGIASGIDTASIVTQLVKLERRPITALQEQQSDLSSISRRLSDLKSKLTSLSDAAGALSSRADVLQSAASISNEGVGQVTASGGAGLGSYSLEVTGLARAQRTHSDPTAAKNQTGLFGEGDLTITVGADTPIVVAIDATDTLETIASKINGAGGSSVTAGIIFDGTAYRLQVSGSETGAANAISFTEGGTLTLGLDEPANVAQAATDATFTLDGLAMTRPTNTVEEAIPGVTLTLTSLTTTPTTITVSRDPEALEERVQALVDTYNGAMGAINSEFSYAGGPVLGKSLSGDAMLRGLQGRLRSEATRTLSAATPPYDRLAGIGVTIKSDGSLTIDSAKLRAALGTDPEAVSRMLAGEPGQPGLMSGFDTLVDDYTRSGDGMIAIKIDGLNKRSKDMDGQIDRMEIRIDAYETRLRAQFTAMEQLVSSLSGQSSQLNAILGQLR